MDILEICFGRIIQLLPSMAGVPEERQQECMECCRELYQMTGHRKFGQLRPALMEAMMRLSERMKSASFLRGLFYTARDFVFVQEDFLSLVDGLLAGLSAEEFLQLLPELRMAFGYFTPLETDRIAGKAAALHGVSADRILKGRAVPPLAYEYGEALDAWGRLRGAEV